MSDVQTQAVAAAASTGEVWPVAISICSLVVALCSLLWNVYSHNRYGPTAKVDLKWALYPASFAESPSDKSDDSHVGADSSLEPYAVVAVRNAGRGQVDVSQITFHLDDGARGTSIGKLANPAVPLTLEGGSESEWSFRFDSVLATLEASRNDASKVFVLVRLGNGKQIKTDHVELHGLFRLIGSSMWYDQKQPSRFPSKD